MHSKRFLPGTAVAYKSSGNVFLGVVLGDHMVSRCSVSKDYNPKNHHVCVELGASMSGGYHMHRPGAGYACHAVPVAEMEKVIGIGVLDSFARHIKDGAVDREGEYFAALFGLQDAQLQMAGAMVFAHEFVKYKGNPPDEALKGLLDPESRADLLRILGEGISFPSPGR